jgi:dTDP-4-dehydrorhamnose reductase
MKILLLGKNGQLGWELQRSLAVLGEVVALGRQGAEGLCGDLADLDGLARTVRQLRPQLIVNAAAYTAVDQAESDETLAHRINALAPEVLAREAASLHALLVHYSTDYVFDGRGDTPWREGDATAPLNAYGRTKREGETRIAATLCRHLIFRTSWVYGARGQNFAKTVLRLASERDSLSMINDQFGAPTGADLLADITAQAVRYLLPVQGHNDHTPSGVYHVAAAGETSWFDYACWVLTCAQQQGAKLNVQASMLKAIPSSAYPVAAVRPHNSRLDTARLTSTFGLHLPHWQQGVQRLLQEIL